uniref:Uncharacterized protein n=1 Tax=Arundo donax TaxID=35708 RepID=A0A0A8XVT9_ARUDO
MWWQMQRNARADQGPCLHAWKWFRSSFKASEKNSQHESLVDVCSYAFRLKSSGLMV